MLTGVSLAYIRDVDRGCINWGPREHPSDVVKAGTRGQVGPECQRHAVTIGVCDIHHQGTLLIHCHIEDSLHLDLWTAIGCSVKMKVFYKGREHLSDQCYTHAAISSLNSTFLDQESSVLSIGAVYVPYLLQFVRLFIFTYYCSKLVETSVQEEKNQGLYHEGQIHSNVEEYRRKKSSL